jgi:hypothetical protein
MESHRQGSIRTRFLPGLLLNPKDGGDIFLRNVGLLSMGCTAVYPRRRSFLCPLLWELQILDESCVYQNFVSACTWSSSVLVDRFILYLLLLRLFLKHGANAIHDCGLLGYESLNTVRWGNSLPYYKISLLRIQQSKFSPPNIIQWLPWITNNSSPSQEILCLLWNPTFHYRVQKNLAHHPVLSQLNLFHIITRYFLKIPFNSLFQTNIYT